MTVKVRTVLRTATLLLPFTVMLYVPTGVLIPPDCCVLMVRLEEALDAPGTTEDGEKEQVAPLGRFPQLKATELLKLPPSAETVTVVFA